MIEYFDRSQNKIKIEKIYGDAFLSFLYENKFGKKLTQSFFVKKYMSQWMGCYYNSPLSQSKIKKFIQNYEINMSEFEDTSYSSFNDFFIRKFKKNLRNFDSNPMVLNAPCEARYFGFLDLGKNTSYPVKGQYLTAKKILGHEKLANDFHGGALLIARLCPVDYHRFHFPCDAQVLDYYPVAGVLHSVNPKALKQFPEIFTLNEREVTLLESKNFGKIAYIEVGAMGVGKIVQTSSLQKGSFVIKGNEKGYFQFGASTVIMMIQKGKYQIQNDILVHSKEGREVFIPLGENIATLH